MTSPAVQRAQKEINSHKIVLFVKGTPLAPQCGFSASVMDLFNRLGAKYHTIDVLSNPDIRAELPMWSQWPTFPQIFIDGKLIGGCDIAHEMAEAGELQKLIQ